MNDEVTYVTFSDKLLAAKEDTIALSGATDNDTDLKSLLILMYRVWQEARPTVTPPDDHPLIMTP